MRLKGQEEPLYNSGLKATAKEPGRKCLARPLFTHLPGDTLLGDAPNKNKPEIPTKFQLDKGLKEQNTHTAGRGKEETPGLPSELLKSLLC